MRTLTWVGAGLFAMAVACSDAPQSDEATGQVATAMMGAREMRSRDPHRMTVMTQNAYVGFDIAPIIAAPSPQDVPVRVAEAWLQMKGNDFGARAEAIADEIARTTPDLIGMQELALFQRIPHDGTSPEVIDHIELLKGALSARGLHYSVAVVQDESDVVAPMLAGFDGSGAPLLDMIEMVDRDVILAHAGVKTSDPAGARYTARLTVTMGGTSVDIVRGWAAVTAEVEKGHRFRFVTTHLEEQLAPPVQSAQAVELLELLSAEHRPVVLVGDFNSAGDGSQTPTYGLISHSGFADAWAQANPRKPGYTCCQPADLHGSAPLDQRIDFVFVRTASPAGRIRGDVDARILGSKTSDRTPSGLWPSDHAGVVTSFALDDHCAR